MDYTFFSYDLGTLLDNTKAQGSRKYPRAGLRGSWGSLAWLTWRSPEVLGATDCGAQQEFVHDGQRERATGGDSQKCVTAGDSLDTRSGIL